jgi:hypothetical protein
MFPSLFRSSSGTYELPEDDLKNDGNMLEHF